MPQLLSSVDVRLLDSLYVGHSPAWVVALFAALSFLGSGWLLLACLPALAHRGLRARVALMFAAVVLTSALVQVLKLAVGRARPCAALPWVSAIAEAAPHDPSFPSGHAAGSFTFAAFVLALDRRWGAFALAVAALVASSRVALGVHYPTDVAFGAVLGATVGWAVGKRAAQPASPRPPTHTPNPAG